MSDIKFALDIGINRNSIYNWKKDNTDTYMNLLGEISEYLNVTPEYLMGATEDPTPPKKELTREEKLLAEIYKLTPEKFKTAEQFVEFLKTQEGFSQELAESLTSRIMESSQE